VAVLSDYYRRPPWEFDGVPVDRLAREAETIVIRRTISQRQPTVRGTVPPGMDLELVNEAEAG